MTRTHLIAHLREAASRANGLLSFIDNIRADGIATFPRFARGDDGTPLSGNLRSLRFGSPDGSRTVTAGEAGLGDFAASTLYRSVTHHDPVLRQIEAARAAGLPQPQILDAAQEVLIAHDRAPSPAEASLVLLNQIARANADPARALRLAPVLDTWSLMRRADMTPDPLLPLAQELRDRIEALPEVFSTSALRWICRGLNPEAALLRQHGLMETLPEPEDSPVP